MKYHEITTAVLFPVILSGCLPFPTNPMEVSVSELTTPLNTAKCTDTVYQVGTLDGTLKEELSAAVNLVSYTAGSHDAPILVAGNAVDSLTATQAADLAAAFQAGKPVVLENATAAQITSLPRLLGDTSFTFSMPEGFTTVEVYAIDREPGGETFQWVQYPPKATADDPDGSADQQTRASLFAEWLTTDGKRMDSAGARNAKAAAGASTGNLMQLTAAFVNQSNFSKSGNLYQVVHYVYGCHSVDTGNDWFYVQQQCVFNGSGAYTGKVSWYDGGPVDSLGLYMDSIELDTWMKNYDNNSAAVGLLESSPQTANNEQTVTSGVSFDIDGEVSYDQDDGFGGKVSGGVSIENSKDFTISDCTAINNSNDRVNNAHWVYQFNRCTTIPYFFYAALTDPPLLSIKSFQPLNQWIWRMSPELRQGNVPMHVKLNVGLVGTMASLDFFWVAHPVHTPAGLGTWEYDVAIPYPAVE